MMKSLFLQAPSFEGYDGGAGARYQMKREVKSFWFPTWLAQAAAAAPRTRAMMGGSFSSRQSTSSAVL